MDEHRDMISAPSASEPELNTPFKANKILLFAHLSSAGISRVIVEFDGGGDSGQIEGITAYADDTITDLPSETLTQLREKYRGQQPERVDLELSKAIEELAYDCLAMAEYGWEINDGAYGEFTFDVGRSTIELDFNQRFMESVNSTYTF